MSRPKYKTVAEIESLCRLKGELEAELHRLVAQKDQIPEEKRQERLNTEFDHFWALYQLIDREVSRAATAAMRLPLKKRQVAAA